MLSLTRERIESLAPDQSSLSAALKLVKPAKWPMLSLNDGEGLLWGECQGSGSTPYRVVVATEDTGYKCTCPSRKFPCKHVLALMWLRLDKPDLFGAAEPPAWVGEWMARRRPGGSAPRGGRPKPEGEPSTEAPSLEAALADGPETEKAADPKARERAQAQRQRLKAQREEAILAGLDELDRWILDQAGQGLAGFAGRAADAVRPISKRLNDAKAGALAGRLDRLSADLFREHEAMRADLALERFSAMALLAAAYRRQEALDERLREDVRRAVGWTVKREALLEDQTALRVESTWIVAANIAEVQPDRLRRLETWLVNANPTDNAPRVAVLIDFVPVSGGTLGFALTPGECVDGEIVFYPSAAPLRGLLARRSAAAGNAAWPARAGAGVGTALDEFRAQLSRLPWLEDWPLLMAGVCLRTQQAGGLVITDETNALVTVTPGQTSALMPLVGLHEVSPLCLYDGHTARVLAVDTPLGRWYEGAA